MTWTDLDALRRMAADPAAALEIGKAAEHLVCASLILEGYRCYLSDQGLPYDVVCDVGGKLVRLQVRAACFPKNINANGRAERIAYSFHVRKRGKNGTGRLNESQCDIAVLVGLDIGVTAYLPIFEVGQTCQLMPPGHKFRGRYVRSRVASIDQFPFREALKRFQAGPLALKAAGAVLHKDGDLFEIDGEHKTLADWSRLTGIDRHRISSRIQLGWSVKDAVMRKTSKQWSRQKGARSFHV